MQLRVAGRASPWLTILVAGAAAAVGAVALRCASTPSPSRASQETMGEMGAIPSHAIHVELAPGATLPGSRPVFTHLPPGTHDERTRWRIVDVDASVAVALAELAVDPRVVEAFLEPDIAPMIEDDAVAQRAPNDGDDGDRCPITTPAYDELQGYVGPAPYGIDAPFAWRAGFRGGHVWFADVEGGWNAAHEDLPGDRITHVGGRSMTDPSWSAHGTAVLGEVVGRDNRKGVTGLAPDVERVFTSSIAGQTVADAIDAAAEPLRPGDVLLIELQSTGPRGRYLPVEYWNDVYAAIRAATDRGVVVIEAAGNGGEDLDRSIEASCRAKVATPARSWLVRARRRVLASSIVRASTSPTTVRASMSRAGDGESPHSIMVTSRRATIAFAIATTPASSRGRRARRRSSPARRSCSRTRPAAR
jgi:hypothetical protein